MNMCSIYAYLDVCLFLFSKDEEIQVFEPDSCKLHPLNFHRANLIHINSIKGRIAEDEICLINLKTRHRTC